MHTHFSGDMCEDLVTVLQFDAKHRVGERLNDSALQHDRVFLWLRQVVLLGRGVQHYDLA